MTRSRPDAADGGDPHGVPDAEQNVPNAERTLRLLAEARLRTEQAQVMREETHASPPLDVQQLIHDLRVHQIELEMQNEELRRTELDLAASRARWFDLYDLAPVGYCTVSESGMIVQANLTLATLLQTTRSALAKQPFSRYIRPEDQDRYYLLRREILAEGTPKACDLQMKTGDGHPLWAHLSITAGPDADGALETRVAIGDIGDLKQAEKERVSLQAQLVHAQKLESLGQLAGGIAHEFNNMLTVILGNLEFALAQVPPPQPLRSNLLEMQTAAQRSADLTRQLLAYSRKQPMHAVVLDLNEAVSSLLAMMQRLLGENIQVTWEAGARLGRVRIDPSQLTSVLTNLCLNARDAIANVGTIALTTTDCAIEADFCTAHPDAVPGNYVRLTVRDTGHGMDDTTLARIFEPFFTTKGVGHGTGLGLASVYGAVKQNGGFITASSALGRGTTFELYLPSQAVEAGVARRPAVRTTGARGHETILLVEDEPAILRLTTQVLQAQGYAVLAASGPTEAMRVAREYTGEIDLLLSDVVLPEMNGRDLAKLLMPLRPQLRQLFMSGYPADVVASRSLLEDDAPFIGKPCSIAELTAKVRETLDRE